MKKTNWLRATGALWLLAFLVWLPIEDTHTRLALGLAACGCLWLGLRWLTVRPRSLPGSLAASALFGALAPLLAITLMAFKGGLHAHGFADFTARQFWETLSLIPVGAVAGAILGAAAAYLSRQPK